MLTPLVQSPDGDNHIINTTLLCKTLNPDMSAIDVYNTVETAGSSLLEEYHSLRPPSGTQPAPPQPEWCTVGIAITAIIIVVAAVCLWKYSSICKGESGASSSILIEGDPPHGCNPGRPKSHHKQPAAVASADVPGYHTPLHRECTRDPSVSLGQESDCATADPQGSISSHGNFVQGLVDAGRHMLKTWGWPLINRQEPAVVYIPIHSPDSRSLHRSLFTGAHDLGEKFLELEQCLFLLVGVDIESQKDAENDTKYLQQMFESVAPTAPRYECVYGPDATYIKIQEMVFSLLGQAKAMSGPSQMFMVFTGAGDANNAMCLSNGQVLSESDLSQWLSTTSAHHTNGSNISVFFDICRTALSRLAMVFQSIALAWSCSVGEYAYAIKTSEDKLIPRSIFLLAIFLAAHDTTIRGLDGCFFKVAFAFHIQQLNEFILFLYHKDHQGRCPRCPPHKRCDPPTAQNPDLQQDRRAVTNLGMVIAIHFPQHASEVYLAVEHKMTQEGFDGRLCPLSVFRARQSNKPKVNDES
ncbi:unnamed protein product [Rhizoctonia solani]|uniref:Uncharacterized protein n=1 Tax=Rhizoctonia solani TaxID=456999 RepID=A0A8H3BL82_9AGAM|nr:unnamed protein product [Rhizoctonia solani]